MDLMLLPDTGCVMTQTYRRTTFLLLSPSYLPLVLPLTPPFVPDSD